MNERMALWLLVAFLLGLVMAGWMGSYGVPFWPRVAIATLGVNQGFCIVHALGKRSS